MLPATGKTALLVLAFLFFNPLLISALIEANSYGGVIDVFLVFLMLAALNIGAFFVLIRAAYELVVLRQGSSGLAEGCLLYTSQPPDCARRTASRAAYPLSF